MSSSLSVNVTTRHRVTCSDPKNIKAFGSKFVLGPLDQLAISWMPVAAIFVYRNPPSDRQNLSILFDRLKIALEILLDSYPHLTGRQQISESDGRAEIVDFGSGAVLYSAECNDNLQTLVGSSNSQTGLTTLAHFGESLLVPDQADQEGPLLSIQHTGFACGAVTLGIKVVHIACDGKGFFQLVGDLATIYRQLQDGMPSPVLPKPPALRPYLSDFTRVASAKELEDARTRHQALYHLQPVPAKGPVGPAKPGSSFSSASPPPVVGRIVRFSASFLRRLKARATKRNETADANEWISTFDAITAYLHQITYRARLKYVSEAGIDLSAPDYFAPIDLRSHLNLPDRYFANATLNPFVTLEPTLLANGQLSEIAKELHNLTRSPEVTSRSRLDSTLKWLAAQPDRRRIRHGFRFGNGCLMVTQWTKFDVYKGATFETQPSMVVLPYTTRTLFDGLTYLMPVGCQDGHTEKGAIDVYLCLREPVWKYWDELHGLNEPSEGMRTAALAT